MLQVYFVTSIKFQFKIEKNAIVILLIQLLFASVGLLILFNYSGLQYYLLGSSLLLTCTIYSLILLNQRVDLKNYLHKIKKNKN